MYTFNATITVNVTNYARGIKMKLLGTFMSFD